MLTGDDTPAPEGEADPGQGAVEAPAPEPDTPEVPEWHDRYQNLHSAYGRQGQELGSLRQELQAIKQEAAELRAWRERSESTKGIDKYESEAYLNKLIQNPSAQIRAEARVELEAWKKEQEARANEERQRERSAAADRVINEFASENEKDVRQYGTEINKVLEGLPRENVTKKILTAALRYVKSEADGRAEESARKKLDGLTRAAALPKGVASSKGSAPARKARTFDEARNIAQAKLEAGG